jgi:hypothetical protein
MSNNGEKKPETNNNSYEQGKPKKPTDQQIGRIALNGEQQNKNNR